MGRLSTTECTYLPTLHALWALPASGVLGGRPWEGWPATVVRGVCCQALSLPRRLSSGAGSSDSATRVSRVRLVRAWGPGTSPTACALAARRCALWGWREGVPGGGAFRRREGRVRSGVPPPPTGRPLGGLSGSARHVLWAWVCWCGGPVLSPWLARPAGAACREGGGGPSPEGVAGHRCEGRLVSGAVPPPAARPLGRAAGVPRPMCPGCGWCEQGPEHRPHSVRPFGPALRAVGVAEGRPRGGVPFAVVRGV